MQAEVGVEQPLKNIHATPFQLYAITDNQFLRLGPDGRVVELRTLNPNGLPLSRPALSDNLFARLVADGQGRQLLELQLARNPSAVRRIAPDTLRLPGDDLLEFDGLARSAGVFSADGVFYLQPAKVFRNNRGHYLLLLFEIRLNPLHDAFQSLILKGRVELPELEAPATNLSNLVSLRFLEGAFFLTSKAGAWRIDTEPAAQRIFQQWMLDVFPWNGKLYITGFNSFDLHESTDGGLTWKRLNQPSELKLVEARGERLFTQEVLGKPFFLGDENLRDALPLQYPPEVDPGNFSAFVGVEFFADAFWFAIERSLFYTDTLLTE
ncbi:MAG: hypothetical protein D6765_02955 [Bacteroidetes bacterium]|nr:MAG: hypothetical protein D6765_02955 [Bacteroidota bacterium]